MSPRELGSALQLADIMDGSLPRWRPDPPVHGMPADDAPADPLASPLGEAFDYMLAAAKRQADGPPRNFSHEGGEGEAFLA